MAAGRALVVALLAALVGPAALAADDGSPADASWLWRGAEPGSGEGLTVGFIDVGPAGVYTDAVRAGIEREAAIAGLELIYCDSHFDPERAIACGRSMADAGADGILNFQISAADSARICSAYGDLPTIAIEVHQPPCERSFVGSDNAHAGFVAGQALGRWIAGERDCAVDTVLILNPPESGIWGIDRGQGMIDGFASVCGPIADDVLVWIDVDTNGDVVARVADEIRQRPAGGVHAVMGYDQMLTIAAEEAAARLGRGDEMRFATQEYPDVAARLACDDRWVAATAYFPDRIGATAVPAIVGLLTGQDVPAEILTVHEAITKENLDDFVDELPDCSTYAAG